jgi:hypothetical protein
MSSVVEYILQLKDELSPKIDGANEHVKKMEGGFSHLKEMAVSTIEALGISFAIFKGFEFVKEGVEAFEKLHQAESQLENTMQNMGTYSKESFEKIIDGSRELARSVKFSTSDIVELRSQLGLVGNIGEGEMNRLAKASADLSTKFGLGLTEAGNMLAKAINSPEMARRLGMTLKIDPAVMEHIQNLAKHGKEAQARMELLTLAESKVGGAAEAAFNADPLARFSKIMGSIKLEVGEAATELLRTLAPAVEWLGKGIKDVVDITKEAVHWIQKNKEILKDLAVVIGVTAAVTEIYVLWSERAAIWSAVKALAFVIETNVLMGLGTAVEFVNAMFLASPIGWIVLGVAAITAAVIYCWEHFEKFRQVIYGLWEFIKVFVVDAGKLFFGLGEVITGTLTLNPVLISKGLTDTVAVVKGASKDIADAWALGSKEGAESWAGSQAKKSLVPGKDDKDKNKAQLPAGKASEAANTKATGQKNVNIHIAINGGLVHEMKIITEHFTQAPGKIKDMVAAALVSAVNDSQIVGEY